jgi:hypothetical protein
MVQNSSDFEHKMASGMVRDFARFGKVAVGWVHVSGCAAALV